MTGFKQYIRRVPSWAYLLVLTVFFVNTVYFIYRFRIPVSGETEKVENGHYIIDYIKPGGAVDQTDIKIGDTIVSCNSYPLAEWFSSEYIAEAGDTLIFGMLRNNQETGVPVILASQVSVAPGFYWSVYMIMLLFSAASLYILYKKGHEKPVRLFFIYIQLIAIASNGEYYFFPEIPIFISCIAFMFSTCLMGPVLIHFHLQFPRPARILSRYKVLPVLLYAVGGIIFAFFAASQFYSPSPGSIIKLIFDHLDRIGLGWVLCCFILAMATVLYQFLTIKDTHSRNQLLIVITGSFFGFFTPICLSLFPDYINQLSNRYINLTSVAQGTGSLIMVCCILVAIFRFRIWDVEVFIRKAILYLGATLVIILTYLILIGIVDRLVTGEPKFIRFLVIGVSVIIFLMLRDRIQHLVDRMFHREAYDSATVVSDFEAHLAGIYKVEELKLKIAQSIDEIFHFNSFIFSLKKNGLIYEPAFVNGCGDRTIGSEYEISVEFEEKLAKSKVFYPEEVNKKPKILEDVNAELVVPLISEGQPKGFFICGHKKSERIYSQQDIRVLSLLAQRVVALLHTAGLYQKDLDRQLMLERERARISQDMHDDVGASLTRISILSELAGNNGDNSPQTKQWLLQISETSREVMEEMSQIIWALNPRNDTLQGLVAYLRRYAFEYLEPTPVNCTFELPENLSSLAMSVEVRRNIYLSVREALHNVVKHSGAQKLNISLQMEEHQFSIVIKDDGNGFDTEKLEYTGNGLVNMKKRMMDIGGEFRINAEYGTGTELKLIVPLK
jgi:signal transduction histidine kinase